MEGQLGGTPGSAPPPWAPSAGLGKFEKIPGSIWEGGCLTVGFPGVSIVKNPPAMQETEVRSLGREDPLEEEMTTYSSIHAWRIPWTEEAGGLQSVESQRVRHD